jgi:SAM-dependent methyltransferase
LGFSPDLKKRYICVVVNLEQLGDRGAPIGEEYLNLLRTSAVIDYDVRNLAAYGAKIDDVPIISFQFAPYLRSSALVPIQDRPIDLLFFGSINPRRHALFSRIESCGWRISTFEQPLYGPERDQVIRQSKAVFNCHYYETSVFEQARAFHTLSLGTPLVSERTPKTCPPAVYEHAVTWVDDENIESFFQNKFLSQAWQIEAMAQIETFASTDGLADWQLAHAYAQALWQECQGAFGVWRPKVMNLGSGKDYKMGWLNVDILEKAQPDLLIDLGQVISLPVERMTAGGGKVKLEEGGLEYVYANNVLEHVPDLPRLMTNVLTLLKEGGVLELEVPFEKSPAAWQDPTHLRAMNMNSWLYYTSWFWYLGWFEHRFEMLDFHWLDANLKTCEEAQASFMRVKFKKVQTTPQERAVARTMQPDFGGIEDDAMNFLPQYGESKITIE